jgi:hypothetical protein
LKARSVWRRLFSSGMTAKDARKGNAFNGGGNCGLALTRPARSVSKTSSIDRALFSNINAFVVVFSEPTFGFALAGQR